jgi:heme oxygenase
MSVCCIPKAAQTFQNLLFWHRELLEGCRIVLFLPGAVTRQQLQQLQQALQFFLTKEDSSFQKLLVN